MQLLFFKRRVFALEKTTHVGKIKPSFCTSVASDKSEVKGTALEVILFTDCFFGSFTAHLQRCCNKQQAKEQNRDSHLTPAALGGHQEHWGPGSTLHSTQLLARGEWALPAII